VRQVGPHQGFPGICKIIGTPDIWYETGSSKADSTNLIPRKDSSSFSHANARVWADKSVLKEYDPPIVPSAKKGCLTKLASTTKSRNRIIIKPSVFLKPYIRTIPIDEVHHNTKLV
jgi:hypothetical protein